ncbi:MAG: hypothetical protein AAF376_05700 [Pseudomonadota bacterium]
MSVDPNILIVLATLVTIFSATSTIAEWAGGIRPWSALVSLAIGLGLLAYIHLSFTDGLTLYDIPDAFIHVAARILN